VIIPKEKLTSFERWQIASFDKPVEPPPQPSPQPEASPPPVSEAEPEPPLTSEESPPPPPAPSAEEIQQIFEETRTAAHQQGYSEGYAAGHAEGLAAAQAEQQAAAAAQATQLGALVHNLQQAIGSLEQEIADQLLDTALAIANEVLRGSIAVHKEALLPLIREAIASLPGHHSHLQVHVNPEDAQVLRPLLEEQLAQTGGQLIENSEISPGGCRVTAGAGEIDASIETRWRRVLEAIGVEPQAWLTN